MAENKTKPTNKSVRNFLTEVTNDRRKSDAFAVLELMTKITRMEPKMWGPSLIGFGTYHYKYASGREGDYFLTGFSPRKQDLTIYIMSGFDRYVDLLEQLGGHKLGKSCLYIKRLDDVDLAVLKKLIKQSFDHMRKVYS